MSVVRAFSSLGWLLPPDVCRWGQRDRRRFRKRLIFWQALLGWLGGSRYDSEPETVQERQPDCAPDDSDRPLAAPGERLLARLWIPNRFGKIPGKCCN